MLHPPASVPSSDQCSLSGRFCPPSQHGGDKDRSAVVRPALGLAVNPGARGTTDHHLLHIASGPPFQQPAGGHQTHLRHRHGRQHPQHGGQQVSPLSLNLFSHGAHMASYEKLCYCFHFPVLRIRPIIHN